MEPIALDYAPRAELGEGPWWDAEGGRLYFVDIIGHKIHRLDPETRTCETHDVGGLVSFVVRDRAGGLVAGLKDGVYKLDFGSPTTTLVGRPDMHGENRFNDGKCDPRGRLWAGTMHVEAARERTPTGALYRHGRGGLEVVEPGVGISNGLGWSPDGTRMYFAETFRGIVWVYNYDVETGGVSHKRAFVEIDREDGVPDGLTVDSQGRVLVAVWRSSRVNIYAPSGALEDAILMPVPCPTSCAFGGEDLRTLFITTAQSEVAGGDSWLSGRLFACRMDVPGKVEARFV